MSRVLLFGTMGDISDVACGALKGHGFDCIHIDFPQNTLRDEPGYKRLLFKEIARHMPDFAVPVGCNVAMSRLLPQLRQSFPEVIFAVESPDKVEVLDSKTRLYDFAMELGFCLPQRYNAPCDVPCGRRVIFKKDVSFGGQGVRVPSSAQALANLVAHNQDSPYLIEEYIEGEEYSVDVLRDACSCRASTYRRLSSRGTGPASSRERVVMPQLEAIAIRMMEALDVHGVCGFDFIVGAPAESDAYTPARAYLLEANPRLTGGLAFQLEAGFPILPNLLFCF